MADDHPIFRDGLCKLLALEEDFEVIAQAQDGKQVLDVLQQMEPDVLLLDLRMPGLDGLGDAADGFKPPATRPRSSS